jgi:hypothetical protein
MLCPGSLSVVRCASLGRLVVCPVCGFKTKPLRRTLEGQRGQVRSHATPQEHRPRPAGTSDARKRRGK